MVCYTLYVYKLGIFQCSRAVPGAGAPESSTLAPQVGIPEVEIDSLISADFFPVKLASLSNHDLRIAE